MRSLRILGAALLLVSAPARASEVGCPAQRSVPEASATSYAAPGPETGACSLPSIVAPFAAAIAAPDYDGSEACGRCARVTGPEGAITVQIVDVCVSGECVAGHLDLLGEAAFDAIADPLQGIVPIAWTTVACPVGEGTMKIEFEGSNPFYLKAQVQEHRHGIASLEMADGPLWIEMARTFDNHFERTAGGPFATPLVFRVTDVHGQAVVTDPIDAIVNGVPLDTGVQLAPCPEPAGALAGVAAAGSVTALRARRRRAPR